VTLSHLEAKEQVEKGDNVTLKEKGGGDNITTKSKSDGGLDNVKTTEQGTD